MDHQVHPAEGVGAGTSLRRDNAYRRPLAELIFSPWVLLPVALLLGAFIAFQFFNLTPRYVKLLFGIAFFIAVVRLPFSRAMILFLVMWPAPTFIFLTDTNVLFLGVMLVVWITQTIIGNEPRSVKVPVAWALGVYLVAHLVSFVNIRDEYILRGASESMVFMTAGVVFFILILNALRTERDLTLAMKAMTVTAAIVYTTAVFEHYLGIRLIPRWFIFAPALVSHFEIGGRAGGVFGSHGLLADFSAISFYMHIFMGMRTRSRVARLLYFGLAIAALHMIGITANRGGAVIWGLGGMYFLWFYRRKVRWSRVAFLVPVVAVAVMSLGLVFEQILDRIRVLGRLAHTQFERGMPETRVEVWDAVTRRIPESLWFGHGPFIDMRDGVTGALKWPHSSYLFYLYSTGIVGLLSYLWILGKTLWMSHPRGPVDFARGPFCLAAQALFHIQVIMFAASQVRTDHQRGNVYIYFMWLLFALALVATRLVKQRKAQSPLTLRQ